MRPISFTYSNQNKQAGIDTLKYTVDIKNYASKSQYFDPYNCPMLNISSVYETPIFVAQPKYSGCIFSNLFIFVGTKFGSLDRVFLNGNPLNSSSFPQCEQSFEIEPYSGITTNIKYAYEVK